MGSLHTLVTGVGGPAGRGVSEYFQQQGIAVLRADMQSLDGVANLRRVPAASDQEFIEVLQQLLDEEQISLLVPTVTEELTKVAEHRDAIRSRNCSVFVSSPDSVRVANDKWETASFLRRCNIAVPRSYCGSRKEDLLEAIPMPILSKPRVGRGGRGITIYDLAEDLPQALSPDLIFQEFLSGEEYDVNLFAEPGGYTSTSVVLKKTALKAGIVGNALAVQRVENREIATLAEDAVRALALEGPLDVDARRGSDGRPAILEINARVGANVRSAEEVLVAMVNRWRGQA